MKPIALQLYSVREQAKEDFEGTLAKVAEFGYAGVEGGFQGRTPEQVRNLLDPLGLRVAGTHWAPAGEENVEEIVQLCRLLDVDCIVGGWRPREDWDSIDGVKKIAAAYQRSAELLKPHGIKQAYHNHWWELQDLGGTPALAIYFQEAPDACAELDVYWACRFGEVDVPAFLGTWASRCPLLHIKDGPLVQGEPHTAVGEGKMDIPAIIDAADPAVLEWLIVELDTCATDMLEAVRKSLEYLVRTGLGKGRE